MIISGDSSLQGALEKYELGDCTELEGESTHIALHYITFMTLHYIALHYIILHYIALHYIMSG